MKKLIALVASLYLMISFPLDIQAMTRIPTSEKVYEEYISLLNDGVIDESVTFASWYELVLSSVALENELSSSTEYELVYNSDDPQMASVNSSYTLTAGDVFVTNATVLSDYIGHAGIVIRRNSSNIILHTPGKADVNNIETINLSSWHTQYTNSGSNTWTKVYRHSSATTATAAATWVRDTYLYSNAEYQINYDLHGTDTVYCSKIVYQAYYYGPSSPAAVYYSNTIVPPYGLTGAIPNLSLNTTFN